MSNLFEEFKKTGKIQGLNPNDYTEDPSRFFPDIFKKLKKDQSFIKWFNKRGKLYDDFYTELYEAWNHKINMEAGSRTFQGFSQFFKVFKIK
jgi:hypothetical protein